MEAGIAMAGYGVALWGVAALVAAVERRRVTRVEYPIARL